MGHWPPEVEARCCEKLSICQLSERPRPVVFGCVEPYFARWISDREAPFELY